MTGQKTTGLLRPGLLPVLHGGLLLLLLVWLLPLPCLRLPLPACGGLPLQLPGHGGLLRLPVLHGGLHQAIPGSCGFLPLFLPFLLLPEHGGHFPLPAGHGEVLPGGLPLP